MESDRPYRKALSRREIISELKENAGTQFDPIIIKAYLKVIQKEGSVPIRSLTQEMATFEPVFANVEEGSKTKLISIAGEMQA
jgi:HD-GYP domain-containing protein (c-di-GMP phosphodiesterase class II)